MRRLFVVSFALTVLLGTAVLILFVEERHPLPPLAKFSSIAPSVRSFEAALGDFRVTWKATPSKETLWIAHKSEPTRSLWQNLPGQGWLSAAEGREEVLKERGAFFIQDDLISSSPFQSIDKLRISTQAIEIEGSLSSADDPKKIPYLFRFFPQSTHQLGFSAKAGDPLCNRLTMSYLSAPKEKIVGFGEQFTFVDMKGRRLPIFVQEQGIGRGAQPITWAMNHASKAGGAWHTTAVSIPHYFTSENRSLFFENSEYMIFDLRRSRALHASVFSSSIRGRILHGRSPLELIEQYTLYAGRMPVLPDWIHQGAILGMTGGTDLVLKRLKAIEKEKAPLAALFLPDWTGPKTLPRHNQSQGKGQGKGKTKGRSLGWTWELDHDHYPRWSELLAHLKTSGLRLLLSIEPFLPDASKKPKGRRHLLQEAIAFKHLVLDSHKRPYLIRKDGVSRGLLDLSSPEARRFFKGIIQTQILQIGASGWIADQGETLPLDALLASQEPATRFHNRYPEVWAQVNKDAAVESGKSGSSGTSGDVVFFLRSGFTQSPASAMLFGLPDQLVSWDEYDGIKSAVTGLLTGGFSGFTLNHADTGGSTTISHLLKNYHRSKELLGRWAELHAFSPIFRSHEGDHPAKNHQIDSDPATLKHWSRMAKLFRAWFPYRKKLFQEAATKGLPVLRHPLLHYPEDPEVWKIRYRSFLLGAEWFFAPVLDPGLSSLLVYLPKGRWIHLWSGKTHGEADKGMWLQVDVPLGSPALFYQETSVAGQAFRAELKRIGLIASP